MTDAEIQSAAELVTADLEAGLSEFEVDAFDVDDDLRADDGVQVVAWKATLKQVETFRGVPVTAGPIPLEGLTLIKRGPDGKPMFRRYIDWLGFFHRLGLTGAMRPVKVLRSEK